MIPLALRSFGHRSSGLADSIRRYVNTFGMGASLWVANTMTAVTSVLASTSALRRIKKYYLSMCVGSIDLPTVLKRKCRAHRQAAHNPSRPPPSSAMRPWRSIGARAS
jgi:hypothetical protein